MSNEDEKFGGAFKKGGPFADNIRISTEGDDSELHESMKANGWIEELPALSDEYDKLLIGNRRLKVAKELGIKPVIKKLTFGDGDEADAKRLRLAIASNIGHKPMTKEDRQRIAEYLYGEREWTMQRIADALNVSKKTVSIDLKGIVTEGNNSKPAKTTTNPKGAGRPKDKQPRRKPGQTQAQRSINVAPEDWNRFKDKALEEGYPSAAAKLGELIAEPEIDRSALSMSAQQKLDAAIRQHKEKLTAEWRIAVSARVDELLVNTIGPQLKKQQDQARWVMKSRKGIMNRKEYGKILACLHPDWVTDPKQKERYADAFRLFTKIEKLLLDERESPTEYVFTPTTGTDWEELKRQASAARKAKRAASKNNKGGITK